MLTHTCQQSHFNQNFPASRGQSVIKEGLQENLWAEDLQVKCFSKSSQRSTEDKIFMVFNSKEFLLFPLCKVYIVLGTCIGPV